ncbi:MAG: GAF domain-containing sensor histidine kinase [Thermodesulfobacteriota bacterium]
MKTAVIYSDLKKLMAVYQMVKEGESSTKLQDFLDAVTRNAAQIMEVKACTIKMLDQDGRRLRFASAYGLSSDYLSKGYIDVEQSGINRQVIAGSLYSIGDIEGTSYFQYPEDVQKEGLRSMLCCPLRVDNKTFGVLCVYSGQAHRFKEADVGFFSLMADLIALTMERVTRDVAKTWFLNKAAHQLRSPLDTIQSMLRLLEFNYLGPLNDKQRETIGRCRKRLGLLHAMVNDLLKLAVERQEVGPLSFQPVDLGRVLSHLEAVYRPRADEKKVQLVFQVQNHLAPVWGRESLMDELFGNLISNAVKYTPAGGRVTVRLALESENRLLFEVADTGIGLSPEDLPRLFTEFFRSEAAKAMEEEGTGLGLVIVREIAERLKWRLNVDSREGQGTRFWGVIPMEKRSGETPAGSPGP